MDPARRASELAGSASESAERALDPVGKAKESLSVGGGENPINEGNNTKMILNGRVLSVVMYYLWNKKIKLS